jgi:hypothetical protein
MIDDTATRHGHHCRAIPPARPAVDGRFSPVLPREVPCRTATRQGLIAIAIAALHLSAPAAGNRSDGTFGTLPTPTPGNCAPSYTSGDAALDALQSRFRPCSNEPPGVRRADGHRARLRAGSVYPQVWLRDSATLIPATRYIYPREYLESWLEEHLAHQRPNGELWDWIAAGEPAPFTANAPRATQVFDAGSVVLSADKNTTASDQETSAVDAAWSVFTLTGDRGWLEKSIAGQTLVDRLDAALGYLLANRFDEAHGLITGALTADWGDVSPAHADRGDLPGRDDAIGRLYANVLAARAAQQLAMLHDATGDASPQRAAADRRARPQPLNQHFWQESRGFIAFTRSSSRAARGDFDASTSSRWPFCTTSRTSAGRSVPRPPRSAGCSSLVVGRGRSCLYPTGFAHRILREASPRTRQWTGGPGMLAMFRRGQSEFAHGQLRERRAARLGSRGSTKLGDGRGQGSTVAGMAALAAAIFQGLAVRFASGGLDITVRLGDLRAVTTRAGPGRQSRNTATSRAASAPARRSGATRPARAVFAGDPNAAEGGGERRRQPRGRRRSTRADRFVRLATTWSSIRSSCCCAEVPRKPPDLGNGIAGRLTRSRGGAMRSPGSRLGLLSFRSVWRASHCAGGVFRVSLAAPVAGDGVSRLALVVGVGQYRDPSVPDLAGPPNDANRVYGLLTRGDGYGFPKANVCLLLDEEPPPSGSRALPARLAR